MRAAPRRLIFLPVWILSLAALLISSPPAGAEEPAAGEPQYSLGEVVVRAKKAGVESVGTVREVTAEQILTQGARTLDEALRLVPGLVIRSGAEGVPRVDLRGYRSRHVLLLLNGVPLNSTYDGQFDPSIIPVENIARIKVSYGTHSVLYGQGGLGGVINIITKAGKQGVRGTVQAEYGSGEQWLGRATVGGGGEKVNFFASGSRIDRQYYPLSDDFRTTKEQPDDERVNSDRKATNGFFDLEYRPSQDWLLGFSLAGVNADYGQPPSTINDKKDIFANSPNYDRVEDISGYTGQAALSYQGQGMLGLRSWAYFNHLAQQDNRYDDAGYDSMSDPEVKTYRQDTTTQIYGINVQPSLELKQAGRLTLGLSAERQEWELGGFIRDVKDKKTGLLSFRDLDQSQELSVYSAALEYEVTVLGGLNLVAGAGYHWLDKDGGNQSGYTLLAGASYDYGDWLRLRTSAARKLRFPSIRQLYGEGEGNLDLEEETSWNYEAGVDFWLPYNSAISLTGFYIKAEDYIEKIPPDDIFTNNDEYTFKGVELTVDTRPVKGLWLSLGYTYMETKDESPGTAKDELQYRPQHKLTLQGRYQFAFGLYLYANVLNVREQVYYSRKEPLVQADLDDFTLVGVKVGQYLFDRALEVYLGADNLLDEDYEESYGFPQPGRLVYGGLRWSW